MGTLSTFIDDHIVLLAARLGAELNAADLSRWAAVATTLQSLLRHPIGASERAALLHIDAEHFTAAVCRNRARYLEWLEKRGMPKTEVAGGSGHNVVKGDSLRTVIAALHRDAVRRLPSIAQSDDEEGESPVRIVDVPIHSAEEAERLAAAAIAEDEMMQKIAELQSEHYSKHKRWVELPQDFSLSPSQKESRSSDALRMEDMTTSDVSSMLSKLGIAEHSHRFTRTTGSLLASMSKDDVQRRFGDDAEAADIFWHWIQKSSTAPVSAAPPKKLSPPLKEARAVNSQSEGREEKSKSQKAHADPTAAVRRTFDTLRQPSAALDTALRSLQSMEGRVGPAMTAEEAVHAAKKALQVQRPPRPSDEAEEESDENDAVDVAQNPPAQTVAPAPTRRVETAPPTRAGRWNVIEYSDEEDEDD